ncbi:MAG: protein-L-isoaspartate(D-aspartate) O-methyltransferase [Terricaulis sp.]
MNDRLMRFVLEMRQAGVTDARVLSAIETTPRENFAPEHLRDLAHDDTALPLPGGQTMSRPSLVGQVVSALAPRNDDIVLEIGTGSGYQAGVLAALSFKLVTIDRVRSLVGEARAGFARCGLINAFAHCGDGYDGWPYDAPYDRIVLNVAVTEVPPPVLAQLKPGGVLLAPIHDQQGQRLMRFRNNTRDDLGPANFPNIERGVEAVAEDAPE